jgi:hypothetical protein
MKYQTIGVVLFLGLLLTAIPVCAQWEINPDYSYAIVDEDCMGLITSAPCGGEYLVDDNAHNDCQIDVWLFDNDGQPVEGFPAELLTLYNDHLVICPGGPWPMADADTDGSGHATISGQLWAGLDGAGVDGVNCSDIDLLVIAGVVPVEVVAVSVNSPDLNGDYNVSIPDLAKFAMVFQGPYDPCMDYDNSGDIGIADLAIFARYFIVCTCL